MISVAMASYNGERYIREQIESILGNIGCQDELVVSDDGSTDGTIEIIHSFKDSRIRLVQGPGCGLVKNFENAINQCRGEIVFLSDQDDYWYEDKVKRVLDVFSGSDCMLVEHDCRVVGKNDEVLFDSFFSRRRVREGVCLNVIRNTYHGCLMAFRSELIKDLMPFPEKGCLHDQWIGLLANKRGSVKFLPETLMDYRRHDGNSSSFSKLSFKRQFMDRYYLIKNLSRRLWKLKHTTKIS